MAEGVTPVMCLALSRMVNMKSGGVFTFSFSCITVVEETERALSAWGRVIQ